MPVRLIFLLVLVSGFAFITSAQTGPGGVGDSITNVLWLEADSLSGLSDDDNVTDWYDGSGNIHDVSQPNASFQPVYKTAIINGLPVVRFNVSNGRLRRTGFSRFPTSAITGIIVNANAETTNDATLSYASSSNNNDFLMYNSASLTLYRGGNINTGVSFNDNSFHIIQASWQSSNGGTRVYKNGALGHSGTGFQTSSSITTGGCLAIGAEQDAIDGSYDATQDHQGDFAEIIMYNFWLNTAQHILVANYLAAKYSLTISNDYYAYEGTHPHDVAGIGREDVSNTHTSAMSAGMLRIENPTGMGTDGEYLLFGHDDADATTWTTTEAPNGGTNFQRLAREWRFDETGSIDSMDVTVDVETFPTLPAMHTMYALLVDADGDFSSGAQVYELASSGGTEYTATGVGISDGEFMAIAAIIPTVEHVSTTSSNFETSDATIQVRLNFIAESSWSVDFTTADGTASAAQPDYASASSVAVNISADTTGASYTISQTNDAMVENDETYTITLSNPSAGLSLGSNTVHTHTIQDEDNARKVYFDLSSSSDLEDSTTVEIGLAINNVDLTNPTTVDYSVTGGTATGSGTDFTLASGTVTFPVGVTTDSISFTVNDESLYENDETIIITLSSPTNCNLDGIMPYGGTSFIIHTYTIIDNDSPPTIGFSLATDNGLESVSPVNFQVELSTASGADAVVSYALSGTATGSGTDYTLSAGTLTITAGSTTGNVTAIITNDGIEELPETIVIDLSAPTDATLTTNDTLTYTIFDDDTFGYSGPGGVGDSGNNILWVRSDDLTVVSDGTDITAWSDFSGNSHDLSQGNTSFTPRYYGNVLNGWPVVRFEQSNNRIIHNSFTNFPSSAISCVFVNRNSDSGEGVFSYASSSSDNEFLFFNSASSTVYRGGTNTGTGQAINGNTWRIVGVTWESSGNALNLYRNGSSDYSGTLSAGNMTSGGNFCIAGEQDGINSGYSAGQSHQGDFTEFMIYNVVLNSAQRKIVQNYLSARYNIAVSNDMFSHDSPGNYENEVAGIGRDNSNNFHLDAQGRSLVRINNPSDLDDGEYLFWGDDSTSFTSSNVSDVPAGVNNRMERIWRWDETGDVGTVSVQIDLTGFTVGSSGDLVLLIDDNGTFTDASQTAISSFASNIATFNNVNVVDDYYFTIASLSPANPLPIELLSFNAKLIEQQVDLNWVTLSEINNDYFTVQKSRDLNVWENLGKVDAAGNSRKKQTYHFMDEYPFQRVSYYRLKQTDFNGSFSFSKILSVEITDHPKVRSIKVFPNPISEKRNFTLEVVNPQRTNVVVTMYDLGGNVCASWKLELTAELNSTSLSLPAEFKNGIYLLSVQDGNERLTTKLVVQ